MQKLGQPGGGAGGAGQWPRSIELLEGYKPPVHCIAPALLATEIIAKKCFWQNLQSQIYRNPTTVTPEKNVLRKRVSYMGYPTKKHPRLYLPGKCPKRKRSICPHCFSLLRHVLQKRAARPDTDAFFYPIRTMFKYVVEHDMRIQSLRGVMSKINR